MLVTAVVLSALIFAPFSIAGRIWSHDYILRDKEKVRKPSTIKAFLFLGLGWALVSIGGAALAISLNQGWFWYIMLAFWAVILYRDAKYARGFSRVVNNEGSN
jgi:hypothetical protein